MSRVVAAWCLGRRLLRHPSLGRTSDECWFRFTGHRPVRWVQTSCSAVFSAHKAKPQAVDASKTPHKMQNKTAAEIVSVWKNMTVGELAGALKRDVDDVFEAMLFVSEAESYDRIDSQIDNVGVIAAITKKLGKRCAVVANPHLEAASSKENKDVSRRPPAEPELLVKRPPVVTIMGHVDHGKTTLLDSLRHSHIVDGEFGGITQHIGAFSVSLPNGERVTILDTPGHAAFSAMRARGAHCTDVIILVVAADDGVKEQTMESLHHAREAGVPIVVAINKIDKPDVDLERVKRELLAHGIAVEDLGGDVQAIPISALKGTNLVQLIEAVSAQAELLDLKADPTGPVEGVVVESRTDQGRGKLATMIVQRGTLRKGSVLVAGQAWAKVRSMFTDTGKPVQKAPPSTPVEVIGWRELPSAGDEVIEVESERKAHAIMHIRKQKKLEEKAEADKAVIDKRMEEHTAEYKRQLIAKRASGKKFGITMREPSGEALSSGWMDHEGPKLAIVIKGDVDGSVEALLDVVGTYHSSQCLLDVVHYGVGPVTQKDIEFAMAFQGVIYSFNVQVPATIAQEAKKAGVAVKKHNIIYRLIDDIKEEINSRLPAKKVPEVLGTADVLQEFIITEGRKKVPVAGCRCVKGSLKKKGNFRVVRDGEVVHDGDLSSMRHLKNEVETIHKDTECGLRFADSVRVEPGDVIECYELVDVVQNVDWDPGF